MKAAHASEAARYHCTYLPDLTQTCVHEENVSRAAGWGRWKTDSTGKSAG